MANRSEETLRPLIAGAMVFACGAGGALLALLLHPLLPAAHLTPPTVDLVKSATNIVAVITSLVLGLLIFSAKGSFDGIDREMRQFAADMILLDRMLRSYGTDAEEARLQLRAFAVDTIAHLWPEHDDGDGPRDTVETGLVLERVADLLGRLSPTDERGRALQTRASGVCADLLRRRWVLIEQSFNVIQVPFLVLLAAWIAVIFLSYGYIAPQNGLAAAVLMVSAASVAGAVVLITDLVRPFNGLIRVPSVPMRKALGYLSQ